jgi:phage/conjugal plasmid C-4 type zinc finger TraR family protein
MDAGDNATTEYGRWEKDVIEQRLRRIRDAENLPSAEECEDCGDPIPEKRREAMPGCTTCVRCQAKREARKR